MSYLIFWVHFQSHKADRHWQAIACRHEVSPLKEMKTETEMLNKQKRHRSYPEMTIEDALLSYIEELPFDGISVCGIWADALDGFGLSEAEAEEFAISAFAALFAAGATLATPSKDSPFFQPVAEYGGPIVQVTDRIVIELRQMGRRPDFTWLWFFRFQGE